MRKTLFSAAALAVCCAAHADFVNGNFGTGNFSGWTTQSAASASFYGVNQYFLLNFETPASGGSYCAFFAAGGGQPDTISQTLSTTAGHAYTLSFIAGENAFGTQENLDVSWDGTTLLNQAVPHVVDPGTGLPILQQYSFTVTGTGSDTASFAGDDGPGDIGLSNMSLTPLATPEPAPMAALGLGTLGLILRRRKRG